MKTKLFTAGALLWVARVLALVVCLLCAMVTYKLWGIVATILGLLLGGVGVIPIAILASALGGHWAGFSFLLALVGFVALAALDWCGVVRDSWTLRIALETRTSMKTTVLIVLCVAFLAGCVGVNPGVVHLSGNDYLLSRASGAGMFANMPALKARVIREANAFAAARGKIAVPVHTAENRPSAGFPTYEYQFRLADPGSTNAPAAP